MTRLAGLNDFRHRRHRNGQALVEFAIVVPLLITMVLSVAEIGSAIGVNMSLELATREGARVGAALVNGGSPFGCGAGQSPNAASVDPQIIASVERALTSRGSGVDLGSVAYIHIYKATASGGESSVNAWYPGAGPVVDGVSLHFSPGAVAWQPCNRSFQLPADSIGVSIGYTYHMFTPLAAITGMTGFDHIHMTDRTVMALEPVQ